MTDRNLSNYISQLRAANVSDQTIEDQLIQSGWNANEVKAALAPVLAGSANNPILPPPPVPRFSMWISFQYILLFLTLWIWSTALNGIWHYAIDRNIVEQVTQINRYDLSSNINSMLLQGYLAAIIVAYPFFAILYVSLNKHVLVNPAVRNIKTRKILMYFSVIAYFLYMVSQLISTVYSFLNGTISATTIPHLLVNLVVPGIICLYILKEMREDRKNTL